MLTASGLRQHYLLGKHFRELYVSEEKLLSPVFDYEELAVYSTAVDRT